LSSARHGVTRITLQPARPASRAQTHAALVLSRDTWPDLVAEIRLRTNRQLRRPHPNPWEVGWILWHYTGDQRFYYIALKPNGWELGKADPVTSASSLPRTIPSSRQAGGTRSGSTSAATAWRWTSTAAAWCVLPIAKTRTSPDGLVYTPRTHR
jgi:hypothetical protein